MFKPSLRVLFPEIADRIFLRLPRALLRWAALSSNSVAFLSLGWRGYMPPGVTSPCCVPETHIQESLFLRELGPVGFYYGLAYRWLTWGSGFVFLCWCSTVGWGCCSFRLGFRGGYWFVAFRPVVSSPCSFYP